MWLDAGGPVQKKHRLRMGGAYHPVAVISSQAALPNPGARHWSLSDPIPFRFEVCEVLVPSGKST